MRNRLMASALSAVVLAITAVAHLSSEHIARGSAGDPETMGSTVSTDSIERDLNQTSLVIQRALLRQRQELAQQRQELLSQRDVFEKITEQFPFEIESSTLYLERTAALAEEHGQREPAIADSASMIARDLDLLSHKARNIRVTVQPSAQNEAAAKELQQISSSLLSAKIKYRKWLEAPPELRSLPGELADLSKRFQKLSSSITLVPNQLDSLPKRLQALAEEAESRTVSDEILKQDMKVISQNASTLRDQLEQRGVRDGQVEEHIRLLWFYTRTGGAKARAKADTPITFQNLRENLEASRIIKITSQPDDASVTIDGYSCGLTELYPMLLPKGTHVVVISKGPDNRSAKGYKAIRRAFLVTDNEPNTLKVKLRPLP